MGNENGRLRDIGSEDNLSDEEQKPPRRETRSEPEISEDTHKSKRSGLRLRRKKKEKPREEEDEDFGFSSGKDRKSRQSPVAVTSLERKPLLEKDSNRPQGVERREGLVIVRKESPYDMPPGSQVAHRNSNTLFYFNVENISYWNR